MEEVCAFIDQCNKGSTASLDCNLCPWHKGLRYGTPYYGQYGWVCPVCNRVNAPWVSSCPCRGSWYNPWNNPWENTWTSDPKWSGTYTTSNVTLHS